MSKQSVYFKLNTQNSFDNHKVAEIKKGLGRIHGVLSVSINEKSEKVAVDYDSTGTSREVIAHRLTKMGYNSNLINEENHVM